MKSLILSSALIFSAFSAFAQSSQALNVCQRISSANPSNGRVCIELISRNSFDQGVLFVADSAVAKGSSYAVEILRTGANRRLDMASAQLCSEVVAANPSNGVPCLDALLDTYNSPDLLRVARTVLSKGSSYAISVLNSGKNAYLYSPLVDACEAVARANGSNASVCIDVIANKISNNGTEQFCQSQINRGSGYVIDCLRTIVVDYVPYPRPQPPVPGPVPYPSTVNVELTELQMLKRTVLRARAQLERGMIDASKNSLEEANIAIENMLRNTNY